MNTKEDEVRAALKLRFKGAEHEVERLLRFYEGRYATVTEFIREWLAERLAEQASWMLEYLDVEKVADGAVARGCVWTMPAGAGGGSAALFVFMHKPDPGA